MPFNPLRCSWVGFLVSTYTQPDVFCCLSLQWRHNGRDSVSNHQPHDCLLNRLFRRRSKKQTSKLRVTGLCAGDSPVTGKFPAQMASYAENVYIWWRHHVVRVKLQKQVILLNTCLNKKFWIFICVSPFLDPNPNYLINQWVYPSMNYNKMPL